MTAAEMVAETLAKSGLTVESITPTRYHEMLVDSEAKVAGTYKPPAPLQTQAEKREERKAQRQAAVQGFPTRRDAIRQAKREGLAGDNAADLDVI